jgi:hypothetical protein
MKYQLPEQVEQKYLPPDQQRLTEHERYFQVSRLKVSIPVLYFFLHFMGYMEHEEHKID